jgi:uncharacterized protein YecT (DUF1311 family)
MRFPGFVFFMAFIFPCYAIADFKSEGINMQTTSNIAANSVQTNYQNSDKKLNTVYADIIGRLGGTESLLLRKIQRLWIKFKEHYWAPRKTLAHLVKSRCSDSCPHCDETA